MLLASQIKRELLNFIVSHQLYESNHFCFHFSFVKLYRIKCLFYNINEVKNNKTFWNRKKRDTLLFRCPLKMNAVKHNAIQIRQNSAAQLFLAWKEGLIRNSPFRVCIIVIWLYCTFSWLIILPVKNYHVEIKDDVECFQS